MVRLFSITLFASLVIAAPETGRCRCRPHNDCWPAQQEWSSLNDTIQGNLVAVRPVASVCHWTEFDEAACKATTEQWHDSLWRAAQPGAVQWENWESWAEHNQTCYIESPMNTICGQGRVSLYSAKVQTAEQIQQAVAFAQTHNLRLAIRNSGHDYIGRSTAPESLQIFTNGMKDIKFVDNFVPTGAPGGKGEGHAVTYAAGVNLAELYQAAGDKKRTIQGGASHTVGAAGGYIQAGGHSPFGTRGGMASDNALEFEVVTADGKLVIANDYQNSDLFWALRGGGGGTFGVVVNVTVRTLPETPVLVTNLNFTTALGDEQFWEAVSEYHAALPALNDAGGSGYYFGYPIMSVNSTNTVSVMTSFMWFAGYTNTTAADKLLEPLHSALRKLPGVKVHHSKILMPSVDSVLEKKWSGDGGDATGGVAALISRLYSRDLLASKDGPGRLVKAWRSLRYGPGDSFRGHVVGGGAVAANGKKIDSAINPAWRKTITHLVISRAWGANATVEHQHAMIKNATDVEIPLIRSVEGEDQMGSYGNEAHPYEPGFQQSFWGDNYPRLYQIKQKWDPKGLFIARIGVGSEDWDDAGLCLKK
ncbi:hypothetical protein MYU51_005755 [Penicillium brevicompactum]|uniref:uncharacterized protein n=1 Tax=Penicillium brevicompactum TaxID=5074 RepID=UPI002540880E|nr:uncharacterized protein N7506_004711 [Penicillium brevicompactum]KAJ5336689.1 hypothetical protein N7506_004711 [Penicillium brevicompactum]